MAATEMTYNRLTQVLKKSEFAPLYLFFGEESFLAERAASDVVSAVVPEGFRDFNLSVFDGQDCDINRVRDALETLPMMAPHRLVRLDQADELKDKEWEVLMPVIEQMAAGRLAGVVLVVLARKIDKRKKHWKRLLESGVQMECKRPYENQIPEWIDFLGDRHRIGFDEDSRLALQQVVGSHLHDLDGEIRKLAIYMGGRDGRQRVNAKVEDVLKVVSRVRHESVFDFTDAVGRGDRARALYCLANLLDQGQNEMGILALVGRHVRILRAILEGTREGLVGQKLAARAGVSPFFLRDYVEQSKLWSGAKLDQALEALLDTDRALKSSPMSSHIWLENFVLRVCTH